MIQQSTGAVKVSAMQRDALAQVKHVALDMDGTIYSGGTLFPFTIPFLALLQELGIGYTFLTNNSSRSTEDYVTYLARKKITLSEDQLYTSTRATIEYLREQEPGVKRLFVLGTASMQREMAAAGFVLAAESADDEPDAVVAGFDMELVFARLCRAAYWISKGKLFLATHPDRVCPTDQPTILVDCGAVCAALREAAGRAPDVVLGKPDPCMIRGILHRHSLRPENLAMVGDRLYTDVAMAHRAGALGVLVLTGETTPAQAAAHSPAPDLVVSGLSELGNLLKLAHRKRRGSLTGSASQGTKTERKQKGRQAKPLSWQG